MAKDPTVSDTLAEAGIIATLIYNPMFYLHSEDLKHNHFYNKESACLYWAISKLIKQGVENIDSFNLETMINSSNGVKNTFEKFGIDLENYVDLASNIARNSMEEYKILANRVISLAYKRDLHSKLKKFDSLCLDVENDDIINLSDQIYQTLSNLNEQYIIGDDTKTLSEQVDELWEEIMQDAKHPENTLIPKIRALEAYFTYEKGEVVMINARYKQGKSAILMNECLYQAQQNHSVVYLDTEMKTKEFTIRALANLAQVRVRTIKKGDYTNEEEAKIRQALKMLKSYKIIHKYKPSWKNEDVYSTVRMLQNKQGLDFLIFDYMKENSGDANMIYNKLGEKADCLKNMVAGQLNIPVLTAAQLNRNNEISDSDKLARYFSTIVYWSKKDKDSLIGKDWKKCGNYRMRIDASRLGGEMDKDEYISVCFDGDHMTIWEAPEQERNEYGL